jgi:acyl-CoA reductase-like NAD-dependent aldehyde dehydrogenase
VVSESRPLAGITMGEIFATSDVPPGVVNLISGFRKELLSWLAAHMDVNAIDLSAVSGDELRDAEIAAAENVKRTIRGEAAVEGSLAAIADYLEMKTVWHPVAV